MLFNNCSEMFPDSIVFFFFFVSSCSSHVSTCHSGLGEVEFSRTISNVSWNLFLKTGGSKLILQDFDFELAI